MKKIIISGFFLSLLVMANLSLMAPVLAANSGDVTASTSVSLEDPLNKQGNLVDVVNQIIKGALGVTGVLALIAFIWGGMEWLISQGNKDKITKGKEMMIWAVLRLVVIFGSYAILGLVFGILGVTT